VARLLQAQVETLRAVVTTDELAVVERPAPGYALQAGQIALLQYTSGSTANPKGVALTHANLLANIRAMGQAVQVNSTDVFVSWLPLYHDMGLIGAWLGSLYHAFPLVAMSPLTFLARPERWLWTIHKYRGTLSASPNFGYELCLRKIPDESLEGLDLSLAHGLQRCRAGQPGYPLPFRAALQPLRPTDRGARAGLRAGGMLGGAGLPAARPRTAG